MAPTKQNVSVGAVHAFHVKRGDPAGGAKWEFHVKRRSATPGVLSGRSTKYAQSPQSVLRRIAVSRGTRLQSRLAQTFPRE
jgi:hypothetical protein